MFYRVLTLALAAVAVALLVTAPAAADKAAKGNTHEGTVVKATDGKLTLTGKSGKAHSHEVAEDVAVTCNGKECKLADLKAGDKIKVTLQDGKVIKIEARRAKTGAQ